MAKNRMIRPEIWTDDKFVSLSPLARLLFVGMWNFACDNGHLDNSPVQLRMRVLPADNCDAADLLDEVVASGMVTRTDGYLKVVNLSDRQPLDLRFLVFCRHCDEDSDARYDPADKKGSRVQHAGGTRAAREVPSSARRSVDGVGVGDGDGGVKEDSSSRKRPATRIPNTWEPTDKHREHEKRDIDVEEQAEAFRLHAEAHDRRAVNWNAAFSQWLLKARPTQRPAERPAGGPMRVVCQCDSQDSHGRHDWTHGPNHFVCMGVSA